MDNTTMMLGLVVVVISAIAGFIVSIRSLYISAQTNPVRLQVLKRSTKRSDTLVAKVSDIPKGTMQEVKVDADRTILLAHVRDRARDLWMGNSYYSRSSNAADDDRKNPCN
jgi:hypothetical protein